MPRPSAKFKSFKIYPLFFLLLAGVILPPALLRADDLSAIPVAIHLHSNSSSGKRSIEDMVKIAKSQNVKALVFTDLYDEHYEYGVWPLRGVIKKTFQRNSLSSYGYDKYLKDIRAAQVRYPDMTLIDGTAATPFYYWSGSLLEKKMVLNNRGKDLLALGLDSASHYENLPVIQYSQSSRFDPYHGDQFSKPYQEFIDEVQNRKALVYWSHPYANEHVELKNIFLGISVYLDTPTYEQSLLDTFNYTGFGIFATDLSLIHLPKHSTAVSPNGLWDRILIEYCQGKRQKPVWIIGEVDFNGYEEGIRDMDAILTMVLSKDTSKQSILEALAEGKDYVMIPQNHEDRLILDEFSVGETQNLGQVMMGGELNLKNGLPKIKIRCHTTGENRPELNIFLIRDGQIIKSWSQASPLDLDYEDSSRSLSGKSYYRLIIYSTETAHRIITNPIFVKKS